MINGEDEIFRRKAHWNVTAFTSNLTMSSEFEPEAVP